MEAMHKVYDRRLDDDKFQGLNILTLPHYAYYCVGYEGQDQKEVNPASPTRHHLLKHLAAPLPSAATIGRHDQRGALLPPSRDEGGDEVLWSTEAVNASAQHHTGQARVEPEADRQSHHIHHAGRGGRQFALHIQADTTLSLVSKRPTTAATRARGCARSKSGFFLVRVHGLRCILSVHHVRQRTE